MILIDWNCDEVSVDSFLEKQKKRYLDEGMDINDWFVEKKDGFVEYGIDEVWGWVKEVEEGFDCDKEDEEMFRIYEKDDDRI